MLSSLSNTMLFNRLSAIQITRLAVVPWDLFHGDKCCAFHSDCEIHCESDMSDMVCFVNSDTVLRHTDGTPHYNYMLH